MKNKHSFLIQKSSWNPVVLNPISILICLAILVLISPSGYAQYGESLSQQYYDWPTYMRDNRRSGITGERVKMPLKEEWVYISKHKPRPAWPSEQTEDASHDLYDIEPQVGYDRAYQVIVLVGHTGERQLYFGSSVDHKVYSIDAYTGQERWSVFTGGPVRLAPTGVFGPISEGMIYVGSDDGYLYCLSTMDGSVLWKFKDPNSDRYVIGNSNMISSKPVRTGVAVRDGTVYFATGLFPDEGVSLYALDGVTGKVKWVNKPTDPSMQALSPQGYILTSQTQLYVPAGKVPPLVFDRKTGEYLGVAKGGTGGTSFALVTPEENMFMYGPSIRMADMYALPKGEKEGEGVPEIRGYDVNKWHVDTPRYKETLVSFSGIRMVIHSNMAYLQTRKELIAFDRFLREKLVKEKKPIDECMKWKTPSDATYSLILADNILFAGGDNKVVAINAKTGEVLSEAKVMGKAYGLAVGKDRLFVSTDQGAIHCFGGAEYKQRIEPSIDPSPYSHDSLTKIYTSVAKRIIDKTGIKQGYCLVLGCGEGRLAYEIAKLTDLKIIGIEKDPKKVETARRALDRAGLYGVRVTIHQGSPSDLSSYPKYFANLIVSDEMLISGKISGSAKDLYHLLRPFGGVAYLGQAAASSTFGEKGLKEDKLKKWFTDAAIKEWKTAKDKDGLWALVDRGPLSGSGEWTHMYANAGNTACSNDKLVSTPTQLLWFGEPGPAPMIDRHQRSSAPLFKDGRMFIAGRDRVMTVDAYNGTILWDQSIPNFTRTGMNLDGGPMAVTKDYLYAVAEDRCLGFNVGTGENSLTFKVPQLAEGETRHWGYLATVGDLLFGSGQKPGASRNPYASGKFDKKMEREVWGEFRNVVTSHYLFALNRHSGEKVWLYQSDGVIPNVAITAGDGRIYFIESSDPKALMEDKGGRVPLKALGRSNLVTLDMKTGKAIWKKEIDLSKAHHVLYLSYAQGCLLVTMCSTKDAQPHYDLDAFNAATGKAKWSNDHPSIYGWPGMGHGQESKHPVIMGNKIISEPFDFDLQTGKKGNFLLSRAGRGCGTISASATCIFFRANTPAVYDLAKDKQFRMSKVSRPGCWLNLIGAGGLILMPEATQGCVCNYPIQASYAFVPVDGKGKVASVK